MNNVFQKIDISGWIQIVSIIATTIISIVSITIATKSLRLTRKSIEDANKPYISCYVEMVEVGHFKKYFVIKNFGKTPATIIDISFDENIKGLGRAGNLDSIKNTLIAPGQKFITAVKVEEKETITAYIMYKDMNNTITKEAFLLNLGFSSDLLYVDSRKSNLSDEANEFRNVLHQFVKKNL